MCRNANRDGEEEGAITTLSERDPSTQVTHPHLVWIRFQSTTVIEYRRQWVFTTSR